MNRYLHIDVLRAVSIIGMMLIHIVVFNLDYQIEKDIWNYLHFVVVAFIFSSGYVLSKYQDSFKGFGQTLKWYKKRILRLAIPYYIYFLVHFSLASFFPLYFSKVGVKPTQLYFLQGITLTSTSSLSWLSLLFIELALLFPFITFLMKKKLIIIYILFAMAVSAIIIPLNIIKIDYRIFMWIPWSLVTITAIYFFNKERMKPSTIRYLTFGLISGAIFLFLSWVWVNLGRDTYLINNEYPPNLFHLSYGISISMLVLILAKLTIFKDNFVKTIVAFFSVNSYSLFFIHYIILDFVLSIRKLLGYQGVAFEVDAVFALSILAVLVLNKARRSFDILRNR